MGRRRYVRATRLGRPYRRLMKPMDSPRGARAAERDMVNSRPRRRWGRRRGHRILSLDHYVRDRRCPEPGQVVSSAEHHLGLFRRRGPALGRPFQ